MMNLPKRRIYNKQTNTPTANNKSNCTQTIGPKKMEEENEKENKSIQCQF